MPLNIYSYYFVSCTSVTDMHPDAETERTRYGNIRRYRRNHFHPMLPKSKRKVHCKPRKGAIFGFL